MNHQSTDMELEAISSGIGNRFDGDPAVGVAILCVVSGEDVRKLKCVGK